jgi:phage/plasmid-like protein (TIGR03299 family)
VEGYALISTSNDGTMATRIGFTSVRVVCNNTLTIALRDGKSHIKVSHATTFDPDKVIIDLGMVHQSFGDFKVKAGKLSQRKVSSKQALKILVDLFEEKGADENKISTRNMGIITGVFNKWDGNGIGADLASANHTAWGLLNAITEYSDHDYGRNANNRFKASQFGATAQLKEKALAYILEVTEDGQEVYTMQEVEQEYIPSKNNTSLLDSLISNTKL